MMDLGKRMKENYELRSRYYLTRRTPVIIRVDGRAFHTLTTKMNCKKPFDRKFIDAMILSARRALEEMQGFKLAYIASDEVSFLITDYDELETSAWFDYNKSKIESISASLMSVHFSVVVGLASIFDCRAFNIPVSEVTNYFLWRARDWHRNSVQMYAQSFFSHDELYKKKIVDMHEMLYSIGKNWAKDLSDVEKNGTFILKCGDLRFLTPTFHSIDALLDQRIYFSAI